MKGSNIKAVFFDIDGTLVSFRSHGVPSSARRAIERLREQGIKVFIATGRLLRHTEIVQDVEVDGYITVNGSYCITASGEVILEQAFPKEVVEKVFELERKETLGAPISASRVRALLEQKDADTLRQLVPPTTFAYLEEHFLK